MKTYFPRARTYHVAGHRISCHAVKQMKSRGISKSAVRYNLTHKPIHKTPIRRDNKGRLSYERYSRNKVCTAINPTTKNVNTVRPFHSSLLKKFLGGK